MLEMNTRDAHLTNVTPRQEKHGEDIKPGCTLRISITGRNTVLDELAEGLRPALYTDSGKQGELDMEEGYLPDRKFTDLGRVAWGLEWEDVRVTIASPRLRADVILASCELKKFAFTCDDGGSVTLEFNVNCHPDANAAGKLYLINGMPIKISLVSEDEEEQEQGELDGTEGE